MGTKLSLERRAAAWWATLVTDHDTTYLQPQRYPVLALAYGFTMYSSPVVDGRILHNGMSHILDNDKWNQLQWALEHAEDPR